MARLEAQDPDRIDGGAVSLPRAAGIQVWRASALALICGYVDAYSLLSFGVYVSFMTGNTTSGGAHIAEIKLAAAGHSLLPIPFFLLGALIGTLLVEADQHRALYRLCLLVGSMLLIEVAAAHFGSPGWVSITILSGAMGLVNTSVTKVGGQAVSLGFMTGDLNNLARQLAMAIRHELVPQANGSLSRRGRISLLAGLMDLVHNRSCAWSDALAAPWLVDPDFARHHFAHPRAVGASAIFFGREGEGRTRFVTS